MTKTYTRSEITPDLLKLNLQYFFDKPAREYKRGIDEIVASHPSSMARWLNIMEYWEQFTTHPPVIDHRLRKVVDTITNTATEANIGGVLDIFEELTSFMAYTLNKTGDDTAISIGSEIKDLNNAIYDKTARRELEAEQRRLIEEQEAEEVALEKAKEIQSAEHIIIDGLQTQIAELSELFDTIANNQTSTGDSDVTVDDGDVGAIINTANNIAIDAAKNQLDNAKDNAAKIADLMENEIRIKRETEELRKNNELIRRSDERDEFNRAWSKYVVKYTTVKSDATAELFGKFLVDIKGLTPKQIEEMEVSAAIFDDGIDNFIDFDDEIQRVKKIIPSNPE